MPGAADGSRPEPATAGLDPQQQALLAAADLAIAFADGDGRIEYINPAAAALTGWSPTEAVGRPLTAVFRIIDPATSLAMPMATAAARAIAAGLPRGRLVSRTGLEHPVTFQLATASDEVGVGGGQQLVCRPVTPDPAGSTATSIARALLDAAPMPLVCLDPDAWFCAIYANAAASTHFGLDREGLLWTGPADWDPSIDLSRLRSDWLARDGAPVSLSATHRRSDGSPAPVEIVLVPVLIGDRWLAQAWIRIDDSDADGGARSNEPVDRISAVLAGLGAVIYRCRNDASWTLVAISDGCRGLLGFAPHDLIDNRVVALGDLIHPDDAGPLLVKCQRNLDLRLQCDNEYRVRTAAGTEKWVRDRAQGVYSPTGDLLFIEGILDDITERKLAQQRVASAEAALSKGEHRFRVLLARSTDGVAVFGPDGQSLHHSAAGPRITGYTHDELMASGLAAFAHQDDRAATTAAFARIAATPGEHGEVLFRLLHKSGRVVWIEGVANNLLADPEVGSIVINYRDVTERVTADRALRESEERLRLALASANQGIYDLDVITGEAVVTPEYATMLGYRPDEFHETNDNWLARLHPDDHASVAAAYGDYIAGRRPSYQVEFRQRTAAGEWRWILSSGRIVERAPDGKPMRMLGTHTDITDRKQTEAQLRRSEEYRRAIFAAEPECVKIVGSDGQLLEMNPAGLAMLEVEDLAAAKRRDLLDHIAPNDRPAFAALHRRVMHGETAKLEFEIVGQKGTRRWMATHAVPLRDSTGGVQAVLAISHDVTSQREGAAERDRLQAQLLQAQKMESIGRLAGGVAHDFNNMLAVIRGRTELAIEGLRSSAGNQTVLADLLEIDQAATRSAELTRQLLAFSRRQPVVPLVIDLNAAITSLLQMLRRLVGEQAALDWQPGAGLWAVRFDPIQIDQVLANLVVNARDALAGAGRIIISTRNVPRGELPPTTEAASQDHVEITVSDTGAGIDPQFLPHLFEPFFSTKALGEGTGLGLATVWGIVRQHGGIIEVESEPGRGSTFRILLPRSTLAVADVRAPAVAVVSAGRGQTILLVEDEPSILSLGRNMLASLGYQVVAVGSPAEALECAERLAGRIDLLVTDIVMPGMNGIELRARLLKMMPTLKCLFLSGYPAEAFTNSGVPLGDLRFLAKPFLRAELAASVKAAITGDPTASG